MSDEEGVDSLALIKDADDSSSESDHRDTKEHMYEDDETSKNKGKPFFGDNTESATISISNLKPILTFLNEKDPANFVRLHKEQKEATRFVFSARTRPIEKNATISSNLSFNRNVVTYEQALDRLNMSFKSMLRERYTWLENKKEELFKYHHAELVKQNMENARQNKDILNGINVLFKGVHLGPLSGSLNTTPVTSIPNSPMITETAFSPEIREKKSLCSCGAGKRCVPNKSLDFDITLLDPQEPSRKVDIGLYVSIVAAREFLFNKGGWEDWSFILKNGRHLCENVFSDWPVQTSLHGLGTLFKKIGVNAEMSFGDLDKNVVQQLLRQRTKDIPLNCRPYFLWNLILDMLPKECAASILYFPVHQRAFCIVHTTIGHHIKGGGFARLRAFSYDGMTNDWQPVIAEFEIDNQLEHFVSHVLSEGGSNHRPEGGSTHRPDRPEESSTAFEFACITLPNKI